MKKYIIMLLALCLVLSGCGKEAEETTVPSTQPATEPVVETIKETLPPPTETVAVQGPTDPLTGEAVAQEITSRPYAIMLNNHEEALPHCGVSAAGVIYETCVEGGMTRYMALFSDPAAAGPIGSVRSARPPFVDIVHGYDAIYSSASAAQNVLDMISEQDLDYINALSSGYFYRDEERLEYMAYEHTLFIEGADLVKLAQENEMRLNHKSDVSYGLTFDDDAAFGGAPAERIDVSFQEGGKQTHLTFDPEKGAYRLAQYGLEYVDGNTDEVIPFRNVLILNANRWVLSNGIHVQMDTVGEGTGYYARDGKLVPIKWSRTDVSEPFTYTHEDGKPLTFGVGKTYVAVIQDGSPVEYY